MGDSWQRIWTVRFRLQRRSCGWLLRMGVAIARDCDSQSKGDQCSHAENRTNDIVLMRGTATLNVSLLLLVRMFTLRTFRIFLFYAFKRWQASLENFSLRMFRVLQQESSDVLAGSLVERVERHAHCSLSLRSLDLRQT